MWSRIEAHYGNSQHGFRPAHSTTTAIIDLLESALSHYDDLTNDGVAIVSFDMSAAFDSINHVAAVEKFSMLHFPRGFTKWLWSYLSDRHFVVKIDGSMSRLEEISRGVPQGSVLGPAIFSVFTGDLITASPNTKVVRYADDITYVIPLRKTTAENNIQAEIRFIEEWCQSKKLTLNKSKSNVILCARNQSSLQLELPIASCKVATILGLSINENLTWTDHIKKVVKKCNQRFFILRKLKHLITPDELNSVYTAIIRSVLEYASPCFVGLAKGLERRLERIERRALKLIYADKSDDNVFSSQLKSRRETASKKLFLKIATNKHHILHKNIPKRLKFSRHFNIKHTRTRKYQQSFFPYVSLLINNQVCE